MPDAPRYATAIVVQRSADVIPARASTTNLAPHTGVPSEQNAALVFLSSLTPGTLPAYRSALELFAQWLLKSKLAEPYDVPWGQLRYEHTSAFRSYLLTKNQASTVTKMLSAIRGVLKTAYRLNQISQDDYNKAIDLDRIRGNAKQMGRYIEGAEISQFYAATIGTNTMLRDQALLALLTDGGLRRVECVRAQFEKYIPSIPSLEVLGKGNKWRTVILTPFARTRIDAWIAVRGTWEGPLLTHCSAAGSTQKPLTVSGVSYLIKTIADRAGIKDANPHDFRRTYISDALDGEKADVISIANQVGQNDPKTTLKYDRRGDRAKVKVAASIPPRNIK